MKYIKGDLIQLLKDEEFDYVAHQCNCRVLEQSCSGIARAIFDNFNDAANNQNKVATSQHPHHLLGNMKESKEHVLNLYTQYNPGRPTYGIDSFDCRISYLKEAFRRVANSIGDLRLGIPLIASGLAKDPSYDYSDEEYFRKIIAPEIEPILKNINTTIVIWK